MENLIKALQIFLKYDNSDYPTYCINDYFIVHINPNRVSELDKIELEKLGFEVDEDFNAFGSYRYGSC